LVLIKTNMRRDLETKNLGRDYGIVSRRTDPEPSIPIHRVYVRNRAICMYVYGVSRVFPPNFSEILVILSNILDKTRVE
jgi:hypothetical protein